MLQEPKQTSAIALPLNKLGQDTAMHTKPYYVNSFLNTLIHALSETPNCSPQCLCPAQHWFLTLKAVAEGLIEKHQPGLDFLQEEMSFQDGVWLPGTQWVISWHLLWQSAQSLKLHFPQTLSLWRFILTAWVLDSLFCILASARMPHDVKEQLNWVDICCHNSDHYIYKQA